MRGLDKYGVLTGIIPCFAAEVDTEPLVPIDCVQSFTIFECTSFKGFKCCRNGDASKGITSIERLVLDCRDTFRDIDCSERPAVLERTVPYEFELAVVLEGDGTEDITFVERLIGNDRYTLRDHYGFENPTVLERTDAYGLKLAVVLEGDGGKRITFVECFKIQGFYRCRNGYGCKVFTSLERAVPYGVQMYILGEGDGYEIIAVVESIIPYVRDRLRDTYGTEFVTIIESLADDSNSKGGTQVWDIRRYHEIPSFVTMIVSYSFRRHSRRIQFVHNTVVGVFGRGRLLIRLFGEHHRERDLENREQEQYLGREHGTAAVAPRTCLFKLIRMSIHCSILLRLNPASVI